LRPDVGVIVVAAGQGARLGGERKPFRPVGGQPMLFRSLHPFLRHPAVALVVTLPPDLAARSARLAGGAGSRRCRIAAGGATRADSVRAGLACLADACPVVLIHDGARPFPARDVIDRVIAAARAGKGAVAAIPVTDTLKEAEAAAGEVRRTVPRDRLWRAQTPQGFPLALLARAHAAGGEATDDAHLVEQAGGEVVLIPDVVTNLKVTTVEDLILAEAIARQGAEPA
jgi:2-C-methyl-D-erythritol 4-phosphate cytidylyltransferase